MTQIILCWFVYWCETYIQSIYSLLLSFESTTIMVLEFVHHLFHSIFCFYKLTKETYRHNFSLFTYTLCFYFVHSQKYILRARKLKESSLVWDGSCMPELRSSLEFIASLWLAVVPFFTMCVGYISLLP